MSTKSYNSATTIKRMSLSPYWSEALVESEKKHFESLGFQYLAPDNNNEILPDIIITNTHTNLDALTLNERENLKLIIHPNSGHDNFSLEFVKSVQCPIILGNTLRAKAVSETILAELFTHYSLAPQQNNWSTDRKWPRKLLSEQKILIIGMGMIGNTLFQTLSPLADELFLYDPFKNYNQIPIGKVTFDVILLAASLNPHSLHIINQDFLQMFSPEGLLINCARGELIRTRDLLDFLDKNPKAFAYLDVFEKEPQDLQALSRKNLKTSSHIAGVHQSLEEKTRLFISDVLVNFLNLSSKDFEATYEVINLKNRTTENFLI